MKRMKGLGKNVKMSVKVSSLSMAISVSLALGSLFLSPTSGAAGLQSKMDSVFNEMSNVSRPGVFETQRRGVLSGGSY